MKKLFLIPARGGSKGLPRKNILPLAGKPMICYTVDAAKEAMAQGDELCISTDDSEIINVLNKHGFEVPFVRPKELASDIASTDQVINHAIHWYKAKGMFFDMVVLLQPTSPLRTGKHIKEALNLWNENFDMVVSVKETEANPYYVLYEENDSGFLRKSKEGNFTRRQDCPKVYEYNGAIYLFSADNFISKGLAGFSKIKKSVMPKLNSIDIDDLTDFMIAEYLINNEMK